MLDELNAVIRIKLNPEDYNPGVEKQLKNTQRKVQMPGFRPGKVPAALVRKMYGKGILVEEINRLLNENIYKYVQDEKLDILGQPLPHEEDDLVNWDNPGQLIFSYDLGLIPGIDPDPAALPEQEYKQILIDEELMQREIDDMRKRYGKAVYPEAAAEGDTLYVTLVELDENDEIKAGGAMKYEMMVLQNFAENAAMAQFSGLKAGDAISVTLSELFPTPQTRAKMLSVKTDDLAALSDRYKVNITMISRQEPAELNEELFKTIYGDTVQTEEEFRARVKSELQKMFAGSARNRFINQVLSALSASLDFQLPEQFLKRWLVKASEKPVTIEEIEADFANYAKSIREQIITTKLLRKFNLRADEESIRQYIRDAVSRNYLQHHGYEIEEDELSQTTERIMKNSKETDRISESLLQEKLGDLFEEKVPYLVTEIPVKDFFSQA